MDVARLRHAVVAGFETASSHKEIARLAALIGVDSGTEESNVKAKRFNIAEAAIRKLSGEALFNASRILLEELQGRPDIAFDLQEALWWSDPSIPDVSERIRRELANSLPIDNLVGDWQSFLDVLDEFWLLDNGLLGKMETMLYGHTAHNLRAELFQHVARNRDWDTEYLFERIGALTSSSRRFLLFITKLSSWRVLRSVERQAMFVETVNRHTDACGMRLEEHGEDGGYPRFEIATRGSFGSRRPKNLIFASVVKPDIRIIDAIDNQVEVLNGSDVVLVYDRPLSTDGMTWLDLQSWWADTREISEVSEAKTSLYKRLLQGIPGTSPPQKELFRSYYRIFKDSVNILPALIPEAWLHWDHKTVAQRGIEAMLSFRMDFLLLLPGARRCVIEVDGMHHYAERERPSPERYARTMRADRQLRLAGYEVFRFGALELESPQQADRTVRGFFPDYFEGCGIPFDPLVSS